MFCPAADKVLAQLSTVMLGLTEEESSRGVSPKGMKQDARSWHHHLTCGTQSSQCPREHHIFQTLPMGIPDTVEQTKTEKHGFETSIHDFGSSFKILILGKKNSAGFFFEWANY